MNATILQHSDQIVATLAKLPVTTYGTHFTKDIALYLADHMNKAKEPVPQHHCQGGRLYRPYREECAEAT